MKSGAEHPSTLTSFSASPGNLTGHMMPRASVGIDNLRGPSQSWGSSGHCHWRVWVVSRQEFLPETGAECAVVEGTADLE